MNFKALLFDLDGTLADTATANAKAYAAALAEVGVFVDLAQLALITQGRNWRQFLPPLLETAGVGVAPELVAGRKSFYYAAMLNEVALNTPLIGLLMASRPHLKTALVTTASGINARRLIDVHGLTPLFDVVVTGDDVTHHKPDPEAYLLAAGRLGLPPEDCLAFEDSDIGVASAKAAGVSVIRVLFQPEGAGADGRVSHGFSTTVC
jgi:HAD superfamily hydrolase (TIGR01509 family)